MYLAVSKAGLLHWNLLGKAYEKIQLMGSAHGRGITAHRHRFGTQWHAMRVIGDWIQFYNHRSPHQGLGMKTPQRPML